MSAEEIRLLFAHNRWANLRVLEAARALAPDDLVRDLHSSFGSIHGTLLHLLAGEWRWLQFWHGLPYDEEFRREDYAGVAALESRWQEVMSDQENFVGALTDEQLQRRGIVRGVERPLSHSVLHVLHHSAYHRGQVSTLLRQLGHVPPAIDFLVFSTQHDATGASSDER